MMRRFPGARVKIGSLIVTTGASGNFLFTNALAGPQVLLIDGPSALYPGDLPVQMTIQPGIANVLPYPVFHHPFTVSSAVHLFRCSKPSHGAA